MNYRVPKIPCQGGKKKSCRNPALFRANGLNVCGVHKRAIGRVFEAADKRWRDAGEPESDL